MVSAPTCFGTELPSLERLPKDGSSAPEHVGMDTYIVYYDLYFIYFIECIYLLIYWI